MTNNLADSIISEDLDYVCRQASTELELLSGNKLLLVGGAGFLGYYFVKSIVRWNKQIVEPSNKIHLTIIDNFSRGCPAWLKIISGEKDVELVEHNIIDPIPVRLQEFTYIIHAASIASPTFYRQYPIETMDANTNGLRNLLEYAKNNICSDFPIKGFLYFSTSEIYGDPSEEYIPTPETYRGFVSCTGPRACYDESKRYGETLSVTFAKQYGLPITIARPFNNYGPGLKISDKRVIPDFARNILNNDDIVLFSSGSPRRTFCYITDAIIGYFKVLTKGNPGEAYNIGIAEPEISILELASCMARLARELFNYTGSIVEKVSEDPNYLSDNPNRRCPDIQKAKKYLLFNPQVSLELGLKKSLLWYSSTEDFAVD